MRKCSADHEIPPVLTVHRQLPVWLICCASASEASLRRRSSSARLPIAIFMVQLAIKAGIFQRNRGLRRQQLQHGDPVRRENGRGQIVFDVKHANHLRLLDKRQTENRSGALLNDVLVRRKHLFLGRVIQNHRFLRPDDIAQDRIGELRGRHERLSEVDLNRVEVGGRFRLEP